jgi:diguanylate cyclase (GGDEF)-like protein
MGIKLFFGGVVVYALVSGAGVLMKTLPAPYVYVLAVVGAAGIGYYARQEKITTYHTIAVGVLVNLVVQLTGGTMSPLFPGYLLVLPVIGYKAADVQYWTAGVALCVLELSSALMHGTLTVLPLSFFAAGVVMIGVIIKKRNEYAAYMKRSLVKYESRDKFYGPARFDHDLITTQQRDIDQHPAIERPLLYYVKLLHDFFRGYSTVIFSRYNDSLTLVQGFSESELYRPDVVVDLSSGIYRQIISTKKTLLITEFVQNPVELGYYTGEIKIASVMIAPIVIVNEVEGIMVIDRKAGAFTEKEKEQFSEAAKTAGLLLALLRCYEQKSDEAKYLKFINEHIEEMHRHKELDLDKILRDAVSSFRAVLDCNDVTIASVDGLNETGEVLVSTYINERTRFSLDDGLVGIVARNRNFIIKEDLSRGSVTVFKKGETSRNLSFIGVPIHLEDELLGVVWCEDHRRSKFNEHSAGAVKILASQLYFAWQRAVLHKHVKELSERDGLTGLYNHRFFQETLETEIERKRELVLIMFDIDHFKKINDQYGHQSGDRVLNFIGNLVLKTGIAARYGGEEFVVILPRCSLKKGIDQAVRIKDHILKSDVKINHGRIKFTVSIGVAYYPGDAQTREELIEKADQALYTAKKKGRNRIILAQTMGEYEKP